MCTARQAPRLITCRGNSEESPAVLDGSEGSLLLALALLEDCASFLHLVGEVALVGKQLLVVHSGLVEDHTGDGRRLCLAICREDGTVDVVSDEVLAILTLQRVKRRRINLRQDKPLLKRSALSLHLLLVSLLVTTGMLVVVAAALALTTSLTALMAATLTSSLVVMATSVTATVLVVATATALAILTLLVAALLILTLVVVVLGVLLRHHPTGAGSLRLRHATLEARLHVVATCAVSPKLLVKNTL